MLLTEDITSLFQLISVSEHSYCIYCLFYNLQNQLYKEKEKAPSSSN